MEDIIKQIIKGREQNETVGDVLTQCYLAALVLNTVEESPGGQQDHQLMKQNEEKDSRFKGRLERMGKILCPIADDVKQGKREYTENMKKVRLGYRGIASIRDLQFEFQNKIYYLAIEGQLTSLEVAIDKEIYRALRRGEDSRTS